jgi:hypothetical protein
MPLLRPMLACALLVVACSGETAAPPPVNPAAKVRTRAAAVRTGQQQDLATVDGTLRVRVPIVAAEGRDFASYWSPQIRGGDGAVLYQDEQGFPARFNVYWAWDDAQGLWLYNTDDGTVWRYAEGPDGWARQPWERGSTSLPPPEIQSRLSAAP